LAVLINTRIFRLFVTFCSGGQNLWHHLLFLKIDFIFQKKVLLNFVHTEETSQSFLIIFFIKVIFWFHNVWSFFYRPFLNFVLIKRSILLARSGSLILSILRSGRHFFARVPRHTTFFLSQFLYKSFTIILIYNDVTC